MTSTTPLLMQAALPVKVFKFRHFTDEQGEPWLVAKDVCDYLELSNAADAYSRLAEDEKSTIEAPDAAGRAQKIIAINEPGLYRLIFSSRKPEAEEFKRWVCHELLPKLRRDGYFQLHGWQKPDGYTGHGRQPFLNIIQQRGISMKDAIQRMNEVDAPPGVKSVKLSSVPAQAYGRSRVQPPLAYRASAWLGMTVEELFTESSREKLKPLTQTLGGPQFFEKLITR